jgi:hypothetical protein
MESEAEGRRYPRVSIGPDYELVFRVGAKVFTRAPINNIGAGGCCARIPFEDVEMIEKGAVVSNLFICGPKIPKKEMQGKVAWVVGKHPGHKDGFALVGIQFINPPEEVMLMINDLIIRQLTEMNAD